MNQTRTGVTVTPAYFRDLYRLTYDPWQYETSSYDRSKFDVTMLMIPRYRYRRGLDLGCSIGVFTRSLSAFCDRLVGVDCSAEAIERAARKTGAPGVDFRCVDLLRDFPRGTYDLIVFNEIGYYFSPHDLRRMRESIVAALEPKGDLVMVHWTPPVAGHAMETDDVHASFYSEASLDSLRALRRSTYRIDVFRKR